LTNTLRKITLQDPEYTHPVKVELLDNNDIPHWDEICIQSIELFGLPGNRYITDIGGNAMSWIFKDQRDALLFKLKFSKVAC
jgi:hypothetical protein